MDRASRRLPETRDERSAAMARCFLTGVEFPLQQAFVLNRRAARDLRDALKDRVACLQRVIEQLSPLDARDGNPFGREQKSAFVPKKHRLVCKAVAEALAPGFPEIELFQGWLEYRARVRRTALHGVHDDPVPGIAAAAPEAKEAAAQPKVQEHETGRPS
jgi:hypothetical protein